MPDEMMAAYLIDPSLITETRRYYVYVTPEMAEAARKARIRRSRSSFGSWWLIRITLGHNGRHELRTGLFPLRSWIIGPRNPRVSFGDLVPIQGRTFRPEPASPTSLGRSIRSDSGRSFWTDDSGQTRTVSAGAATICSPYKRNEPSTAQPAGTPQGALRVHDRATNAAIRMK